jgi:hypothetical protein
VSGNHSPLTKRDASVHWTQILFAIVLVTLLLALAGYYAWRQVQTLRGLRDAQESAPDERSYLRRRAWRRLFGSLFMVVVAGLLGGMMLFLEERANELTQIGEAARARGEEPRLDADQRQLTLLYGYWIIALLLSLLAMLTMAFFDMLATRRFSLGQLRRIQGDRRAMIEREVARYRQERNGHL